MMHDFPYTDLHELNLDWFLEQFKNLKKLVEDLKKIVINAPDATTATAGQAPIADGQGGWAWGDIEAGDSVPTSVRQAILALFQNGVYTRDDMSDEVAVIQSWATEITAISVSPTTLNINSTSQQTIVATTQPAGGAVTWSSSDESIATVSGGVVTPTGINGTCTITASCGGKSATCAVTISGFATLLSISAVYTQSGAVYDTDTLDSLKSNLVVTANYDDDRSVPVTGYTLSGTLTVGTSTITVSYGGYTDTFNVTVTSNITPVPWYGGGDQTILAVTDNGDSTYTLTYPSNTTLSTQYYQCWKAECTAGDVLHLTFDNPDMVYCGIYLYVIDSNNLILNGNPAKGIANASGSLRDNLDDDFTWLTTGFGKNVLYIGSDAYVTIPSTGTLIIVIRGSLYKPGTDTNPSNGIMYNAVSNGVFNFYLEGGN